MNDDAEAGPDLTPDAAERHIDRGMMLAARMDLDGALAEFAAVEADLRFSSDPAARVQWARSLNGLGLIDLMDAKAARAAVAEFDQEAEQAFRWGVRQALARFEQALSILVDPRLRAEAAGNKAYALALLDRVGDAEAVIRALFADGGRSAHEEQIQNTERHPIPEDRAVRRMIDDIWQETAR